MRDFFRFFSEPFLESFGYDSTFVRATADAFTLALARLLDSKGLLNEDLEIAVLGPEAACRAVRELLGEIPEVRPVLMQEACGYLPSGSFEKTVDSRLRSGFFKGWLSALEAGEYSHANDLLVAALSKQSSILK